MERLANRRLACSRAKRALKPCHVERSETSLASHRILGSAEAGFCGRWSRSVSQRFFASLRMTGGGRAAVVLLEGGGSFCGRSLRSVSQRFFASLRMTGWGRAAVVLMEGGGSFCGRWSRRVSQRFFASLRMTGWGAGVGGIDGRRRLVLRTMVATCKPEILRFAQHDNGGGGCCRCP